MLTDFSENAIHAAKAAGRIVPQLNAAILIYSTYYDHPILPTYASGYWVVESVFQKDESITAAALDKQHLPLMIIPAGMN